MNYQIIQLSLNNVLLNNGGCMRGKRSELKIVKYEYEQFLNDIADGSMAFRRYINESHYEDEYSHNDIEKAQDLFIKMVKNYLHNNHPNKYVVSSDWCVFIMTPERARQSNISEKTIELFTVK